MLKRDYEYKVSYMQELTRNSKENKHKLHKNGSRTKQIHLKFKGQGQYFLSGSILNVMWASTKALDEGK